MKELLEDIVRAIVDDVDAVKVNILDTESTTIYELHVAKEDVGKVFTMYYSTKPGGTGLGLPIAARVIQEHGGSIEIHPGETEGTTVSVNLPL